jgi:ribokinase
VVIDADAGSLMGDVWIVGSLNVDLISRVHRLPSPGETVAGGDLERRPGGKGANQAVAAASAGAAVRMVGRVGDDAAASAYLAGLQGRSIDTSGIATEPDCDTGLAIVLVDDGAENCIVVIPGANGRVGPEDVTRFRPSRDDVLLLQLELPTAVIAEAIAVANQAGARTLLNLAPYRDLDADLIAGCDIILVNEHEAEQLAASGVTPLSLVITRGAKGASWGDRSSVCAAEAVVDTTGAGDAFAGAFAAALAAGDDDQTALDRAAAAGAAAVGWPGAQGWKF